MNEAETRAELIDPALAVACWGVVEGSKILREYPISPGRIEGHGRRGKPTLRDRDEEEERGTPATATGNLTRAFVGKLFDRLTLSAHSRKPIRAVCKVVNEPDIWPLHRARVVAECAGLLARRNKRFQLTRAGRELLPDEQAGALYRQAETTAELDALLPAIDTNPRESVKSVSEFGSETMPH